ncbi:unnamed protein product [Ceratitis capitata]|uniref:(Mediterranean fruit fly) hypothetical protein n=1 Tax=Ceratitis capitata TaxID=7213 RepID=A0A811U0C3_CERCA|nr:unnamed protein product [Ceratitis capitata]
MVKRKSCNKMRQTLWPDTSKLHADGRRSKRVLQCFFFYFVAFCLKCRLCVIAVVVAAAARPPVTYCNEVDKPLDCVVVIVFFFCHCGIGGKNQKDTVRNASHQETKSSKESV